MATPFETDTAKIDGAAAAIDQARDMEAKATRLENEAGWLRLRANELRKKARAAVVGVYGRKP